MIKSIYAASLSEISRRLKALGLTKKDIVNIQMTDDLKYILYYWTE